MNSSTYHTRLILIDSYTQYREGVPFIEPYRWLQDQFRIEDLGPNFKLTVF